MVSIKPTKLDPLRRERRRGQVIEPFQTAGWSKRHDLRHLNEQNYLAVVAHSEAVGTLFRDEIAADDVETGDIAIERFQPVESVT